MHSEPPLGTVVLAIVSHTPVYVWAILAGLVVLGSLQLRSQRLSRARAELGWNDDVTFEQGVDRTIEWVRCNLREIERLPQSYVHKA